MRTRPSARFADDRAEGAYAAPAGVDRCPGVGQRVLGIDNGEALAGRLAVMHARDHFLPDEAALPEGDTAVEVHQHVVRKGVGEREVAAGLRNGGIDAQPVIVFARGLRRAFGPAVVAAPDVLARAKPRVLHAAFGCLAPADGDGRLVDRRDLRLGAQLVERQAPGEAGGVRPGGLDAKAVLSGTRDQEVEQDLALRREQGAGTGFSGCQRGEIGGQDALQQRTGIRSCDFDEASVGQAQ